MNRIGTTSILLITAFACIAYCLPLYSQDFVNIVCVNEGNTDVVHMLLASGSDVDAVDEDGYTALHHAAIHNKYELAQLLIKYLANVNKKELGGGYTPLHFAAGLIIKGEVMETSQELVNLLVDNGADVNVRNHNGVQPLGCAIMTGNLTIAKCLIERGADVNFVSIDGASPLHIAVSLGNLEAVIFLVENNANIHSKDYSNRSPLSVATSSGNSEILEYLKSLGAK